MKITPPTWITISRIFISIILAIFLYTESFKTLTIVLFLVAALTDYADGFFARRAKNVSNLGKFLDPAADKVFVYSIMFPLISVGKIHSAVVLAFIARDILVGAFRSFASSQKVIAANWYGKSKTVFQIFALFILIIVEPNNKWFQLGTGLLYLSLFLSIVSGSIYTKSALKSRKA